MDTYLVNQDWWPPPLKGRIDVNDSLPPQSKVLRLISRYWQRCHVYKRYIITYLPFPRGG
jgi:hypothetical protein